MKQRHAVAVRSHTCLYATQLLYQLSRKVPRIKQALKEHDLEYGCVNSDMLTTAAEKC